MYIGYGSRTYLLSRCLRRVGRARRRVRRQRDQAASCPVAGSALRPAALGLGCHRRALLPHMLRGALSSVLHVCDHSPAAVGVCVFVRHDVYQCPLELLLLSDAKSLSCLCDWFSLWSGRTRSLCPSSPPRSPCGVLPVALFVLSFLRRHLWIPHLEAQCPNRRLTNI